MCGASSEASVGKFTIQKPISLFWTTSGIISVRRPSWLAMNESCHTGFCVSCAA